MTDTIVGDRLMKKHLAVVVAFLPVPGSVAAFVEPFTIGGKVTGIGMQGFA